MKTREKTSNIIIGNTYGNLTVLQKLDMHTEPNGHRRRKYLVKCNCGTEYETIGQYIIREKDPKCQKCKASNMRSVKLNEKYDKLTIIGFKKRSTKSAKTYAICKCDCGNIIDMRPCSLLKNKTNNCGCYHNGAWQGYKDCSKTYFGRLKRNAEKRKINFNLSIEYLYKLYEAQNKKCALSGIDIVLYPTKKQTASLDRIDSSKGYVENNVQWVHKHVNVMKLNHKESYFIDLCKLIAKHNT